LGADPAQSVAPLERLPGPQHARRRGLLADPGPAQELDPWRSAAVERRELGAVELRARVVDAEAEERGEQVLDRRRAGAALPDRRRALRPDHRVGPRRDLDAPP